MAGHVPPDLFWSFTAILFYSAVILFLGAVLKVEKPKPVPDEIKIVIYAIIGVLCYLILKRITSVIRFLFASKLQRHKWDLIKRIRAHVGYDSWFRRIFFRRRPLNIAIVGTQGTGKSAFMNSVIAAFNEECWEERCKMGTFVSGRPVTVTNTKIEDLRKARYQRGYMMPNLIDVAGFPDEDNDKWKEVLRILFHGCLPEDVPINAAAEYYDELTDRNYSTGEKIQRMRERYPVEDPKLKVDRIIFVAGYTEPIRQGLIKNVIDAATPTGLRNDLTQRGVPIFGALTKEDRVEKGSQEARDKRELFRDSLGIDDSRVLSCSNYCQQIDERLGFDRLTSVHPALDVPILNFFCQVCNPSREVTGHDRRLLRNEPPPRRSPNLMYILLFALNAIAIAMAMFYIFQIPLDPASFMAVCLQVKDGHIKNSAMAALCEATKNGKLLQPNYFYATIVTVVSVGLTVIISNLREG